MSVANESLSRHGKGLFLSWIYERRFPVILRVSVSMCRQIGDDRFLPFSMNSDTINIRPSGSGARDRPR